MKKIISALLIAFSLSGAFAGAQQLKPQHQAAAKDCAVCHTQENAVNGNAFVTPNNKACLTCHQSYEALAQRTAKLPNGEPNPHASHHYGSGISCTACHSEHKPAQQAYCNNCHSFKYQQK